MKNQWWQQEIIKVTEITKKLPLFGTRFFNIAVPSLRHHQTKLHFFFFNLWFIFFIVTILGIFSVSKEMTWWWHPISSPLISVIFQTSKKMYQSLIRTTVHYKTSEASLTNNFLSNSTIQINYKTTKSQMLAHTEKIQLMQRLLCWCSSFIKVWWSLDSLHWNDFVSSLKRRFPEPIFYCLNQNFWARAQEDAL